MKLIAAVGAVAVIVAGVAAYLVGSAGLSARAAQVDSNRVLDSAGAHTKQIDDSLKAPDFNRITGSSTSDLKAAKRTSDDYVTRLDQAVTTVTGDRRTLASADGKLGTVIGNPWATPFRSGLQDQHNRVRSVMSALDAGASGLQIERDQMRTMAATFDAMADFSTIGDDLNRNDIAAGLSVIPGLQQKMQTAVRLSQGPNNPPQLQQMLTTLQKTITDIQALLQAAQRKDAKTVNTYLPKLDADDKALEAFDQKGFDAYNQKLIQPYKDRYEAGWKAAGFHLQS